MSEHEDLEDGEIEDDEEEQVVLQTEEAQIDPPLQPAVAKQEEDVWDDDSNAQESVDKLQNVKNMNSAKARLIDEVAPPKTPKRSKPAPVVDDWATSVEAAIANALKKDGVQPPMPAISHRHEDNEDDRPSKRKRRERNKKKSTSDKPEELEEMDLEYEMMNVRGGSPRPPAIGSGGNNYPDRSESDDSYSSDDSRDRDRGRDRDRRDRDRERDREYTRRKRKNRQRNRANRDGRKRKRDDSDDEKHHRNNGPRKMELCKFYLMDCCAKRFAVTE